MPPHKIYIETHLGGGAVLRNKKAAIRSVGIDIDARVIALASTWNIPNLTLHRDDAAKFLRKYRFSGEELIYADPPYVSATKARRRYYRFEYTDDDHAHLLHTLSNIDCRVLISGYACELYNDTLQGWNKKELVNVTRGGKRTETVWANYNFSDELQDYSCVGSSFRERERIKRKAARWVRRLRSMPSLERRAVMAALLEAPAPPSEGNETGANQGAAHG